MEEPSRLERLLERRAGACAFFLVATLALTWPLAARLGAALPAGAGDLLQNCWNFWWWKTALLQGRSPEWTPYLFHPSGVSLVFHTHSPFNMLLLLPVTLLAGPEAAYGAAVLLAVWLSGFGACLLAREVTGSARAGILAGLVFAFFPQHLEQTLEHLNLFSTQFFPIAAWAFLRLARKGGLRPAALLGVVFSLNALCDWHLGLKLTLLLCALGGAALARPARPRRELLRDVAAAALVAALLIAPFAWPLVRGMAAGATYQKPSEDKGIDAAFLLRPHFHHPLWGALAREAYAERRAYPSAGFVCYLGVAPLVLAGIALARRARGAVFWSAVFGVSLLLALGAHPYWNGRLVGELTLPFALLERVPLIGLLRVANRFLVPASLALGVLAALGFAALRTRSDARFVLIAGLLALDYLWLPYPLRSDAPSPYYARLRGDGPRGAVLDIPFTEGAATVQNMRAQTVHGRPIAGGYVSVLGPEPIAAIARTPALADLFGLRPALRSPLDRAALVRLGFGVAILHKDRRAGAKLRETAAAEDLFAAKIASRTGGMPDGRFREARRRLEEACGPPVYEDGEIAAFDLTLPR